ncbi:hypothetical protein ACFP8W_00125 [Nocardioides hankookensis]|uniref:Toxin-antitoxin system HicB family antitoxin n=1 Tax=Nocardioides hankookensis TaxID=443157 RepID=A0ABW1LP26_9ACTN
MQAQIPPALRDHVNEMATRAGISLSIFMELLLAGIELDDRGLPPWIPTATDPELPLQNAS